MSLRTVVRPRVVVALFAAAALSLCTMVVPSANADLGVTPNFVPVSPRTNSGFLPGGHVGSWRARVPGITEVRITSTADGHQQPALWLPPNQPGPRPLLVALHSWSVGYDQVASIPYGTWAQANGWAMIHPDFRGVSNNAAATGSDLAIQDIVDAIDWASSNADIDPHNIYVIGFSGGGMMSLNMAGRHPERIAGAVSWVPIYDLVEWYRHSYNQRYIDQIGASCGGNPFASEAARQECLRRSPRAVLDNARRAGVPVYIGHGLQDRLVPPNHAVWAFNHLVGPGGALTEAETTSIARNVLPGHLAGRLDAETFFRPGDPTPLYSRQSGNVTLVLFQGGHNAVFNPGLEWMVHRVAASQPSPQVRGAVARLYGTAFAREPDTNGLAYWERLYLHGRSLPWMATHFATSPEFVATYGSLNDGEFVRRLYLNVFDREPDAGGLQYWTNMLRQGRSRGWVLLGFSQSGEMRTKTGTR